MPPAPTLSTHAGLSVRQAKYKERGTVLAEDQLAQVSRLEGSRQEGRPHKAGQDTSGIN